MTKLLDHASTAQFTPPASLWDEAAARGMDEAELLLYRSNLLGSDLTVTNFGGGNTSAKIVTADPVTGEQVDVLWVKGSGGDIGSMSLGGFATLRLDRLAALEHLLKTGTDEDALVDYLPLCAFGANGRPASIDTPLHGLLPFRHIDHLHPDAVIALAAAEDGEKVTRELWGGEIGWLGWKRPGFELAVALRDLVAANPGLRGVMLEAHGIIAWADTAQACYENSLALIGDASRYLNRLQADRPAFGGVRVPPRPAEERRTLAARIAPLLRGEMRSARRKLAHFTDDDETLEFVGSHDLERLAALGTSCPDHFLRTKIKPLVLDPGMFDSPEQIAAAFAAYRADYSGYYQRNAQADSPAMRDDDPVIVLLPGIGRFAFSTDRTTARIASEFYGNAINVMRGAELIGGYLGLDEGEAFRIEYWSLEEAKLQRMPAPRPLAGKIALVTGAAGGIGQACARRLAADGACVMLLDREAEALNGVEQAMAGSFGRDTIALAPCDVTDPDAIARAFAQCALRFGGVDIVVANAGIASSAPVEETDSALWRRNFDVLAEGYFLTARESFHIMRQQDKGGSIVFIGSKNALAAAANASAYASAKAAALHLARCLALEGAASGIRVNTVNPDAVIKGSRIWDGAWRAERAGAHGIDAGQELEEHYRQRSLLGREVLPEDVAEAVAFFAGPASDKSTGNIVNVDAGNREAFTR